MAGSAFGHLVYEAHMSMVMTAKDGQQHPIYKVGMAVSSVANGMSFLDELQKYILHLTFDTRYLKNKYRRYYANHLLASSRAIF